MERGVQGVLKGEARIVSPRVEVGRAAAQTVAREGRLHFADPGCAKGFMAFGAGNPCKQIVEPQPRGHGKAAIASPFIEGKEKSYRVNQVGCGATAQQLAFAQRRVNQPKL